MTVNLLAAVDGSSAVQLFLDGTLVSESSQADSTLPTSDFSTCSTVTMTSGVMSAGTHNATIVKADGRTSSFMFLHSFV